MTHRAGWKAKEFTSLSQTELHHSWSVKDQRPSLCPHTHKLTSPSFHWHLSIYASNELEKTVGRPGPSHLAIQFLYLLVMTHLLKKPDHFVQSSTASMFYMVETSSTLQLRLRVNLRDTMNSTGAWCILHIKSRRWMRCLKVFLWIYLITLKIGMGVDYKKVWLAEYNFTDIVHDAYMHQLNCVQQASVLSFLERMVSPCHLETSDTPLYIHHAVLYVAMCNLTKASCMLKHRMHACVVSLWLHLHFFLAILEALLDWLSFLLHCLLSINMSTTPVT